MQKGTVPILTIQILYMPTCMEAESVWAAPLREEHFLIPAQQITRPPTLENIFFLTIAETGSTCLHKTAAPGRVPILPAISAVFPLELLPGPTEIYTIYPGVTAPYTKSYSTAVRCR